MSALAAVIIKVGAAAAVPVVVVVALPVAHRLVGQRLLDGLRLTLGCLIAEDRHKPRGLSRLALSRARRRAAWRLPGATRVACVHLEARRTRERAA